MILSEITFLLAVFISVLGAGAWLAVQAMQSQRKAQFAALTLRQPFSQMPNALLGGLAFLKSENLGFSDTQMDLQGRLDVEIQRRLEAERKLESVILEKDTLVKEIHHRIKNNLAIVATLLEMAARDITDPLALSALENSKGRILAMAMIHEQLYRSQNLTTIDLGEHIRHLAADLLFAYSNNPGIRLNADVEVVMIDLERAIPCGLIVNELVTNALKYGFPKAETGVIGVSVRQVHDEIEVCVSDDGGRLPETFLNRKTKSLGMDLVRILSYQLRASLDIQREGITSFTFRFPFIDPEA